MNVKDLMVRLPVADIAEAFVDKLNIDDTLREKAIRRVTEIILTLCENEPCETGYLLLGIYHLAEDGEFLDPCLYSRKELSDEFESESEIFRLKSMAEIDALEEEEIERLAHCKTHPESYSFMLSPWKEILGYELDDRNVREVGAAALCAEILYEMTFFGFDEDTVEAERQKLEASLRESEEIRKLPEEEQKKYYTSAEELFAKLNFPKPTQEQEEEDHRRLCREVLVNKWRTHQALRKYIDSCAPGSN